MITHPLKPLSADGKRAFFDWVKQRTLREARERLDEYGELLDRSEKRAILDDAFTSIADGTAELRAMTTLDGLVYLAWLHVGDPDVPLSAVARQVEITEMDVLKDAIDRANGKLPELATIPDVPTVPAPPARPPWEIEEEQRKRRKSIFDTICTKHELTPQSLDELPIDKLLELYVQEVPENANVDKLVLKGRAHEYRVAVEGGA